MSQAIKYEANRLAPRSAYSLNSAEPLLDLAGAGHNGYVPEYNRYATGTAYVRRDLIPVLISPPRGMYLLNNPDVWIAALKTVIEALPDTIEGLNQTVNVEYDTSQFGANEKLSDAVRVSRTPSEPTFNYTDKYGGVISTFFTQYIYTLLGHPDTGIPTIMSIIGNDPTKQYFMTADFTGLTVLFMEPDPTHRYVIRSYLCTNMMPETSGEITGGRAIAEAKEIVKLSIKFTCLQQVGAGPNYLAKSIMDARNITGLNPDRRKAFVGDTLDEAIDAYVRDAKNTGDGRKVGYMEQVENIASIDRVPDGY